MPKYKKKLLAKQPQKLPPEMTQRLNYRRRERGRRLAGRWNEEKYGPQPESTKVQNDE